MSSVNTFYDGSTVLQPVSNVVGMELDKVNFVMCMLASLPIGYLYRKFMPADRYSREARSGTALAIGLMMQYFCFGWAIKHLLINSLSTYAMMHFVPAKNVHLTVFFLSMSYLLWMHFYRWLVLTSYVLDVTGPMMVAVQKMTTLAFNLHDGRGRERNQLTDNQRKEAITEVPTLLDYLSYIFNFQTGLMGPTFLYADYDRYLDGKHLPAKNGESTQATPLALKKFGESLLYAAFIFSFRQYKVEDLVTPEYAQLPITQWVFWIFISVYAVKCNYYFGWTLADSVCNISGFGFSGLDESGEEQWELCTNVKPTRFELAQSFKESLDVWNIQTGQWLKRIAYDRTPQNVRTIATYGLSAVWHGVSAGYYLCFASCAICTLAGSTWRRCMRWRFLDNVQLKFGYDIFSFLVTKFALVYCTVSFVALDLSTSFIIYSRLYFLPHLIGLLVHFTLPMFFKPMKKHSVQDKVSVKESGELSKRLSIDKTQMESTATVMESSRQDLASQSKASPGIRRRALRNRSQHSPSPVEVK